jgi:hypothetical protein
MLRTRYRNDPNSHPNSHPDSHLASHPNSHSDLSDLHWHPDFSPKNGLKHLPGSLSLQKSRIQRRC